MQSGKRLLSLFDFTMIMISLVIGMGIFRTPVNVAQAVDTPWTFLAVWLAGGLVAVCGALTYAEIGSRYPVTGGYYKVFSYAYHPSIAFGVNGIILISNAASLAGVALIGAEYLTGVIWPGQETGYAKLILAIAAVLLFYGVNLLGLKMSARVQNVLMLVKIGMILFLILPLFTSSLHPMTWSSAITERQSTGWEWIQAFGVGLIAVSFTYGGYQQSINFGAEIQDARKNLPRGILLGLLVIIGLYLLINYAYLRVLGWEQLRSSENIAARMAEAVLGERGGQVLSMLLFLSVLAYVNVLLMSNPRVMAAMSEDGILPAVFGKRHPRSQVLVTGLTAFASLCVVIVYWAKTFDEVLSFSIFLDCFGMVLSAATLFIIRKRTAHLNGTGIYQQALYPLMPIVFMLAYTLVGISIAVSKPKTAITGTIILLLFTGLYFVFQRRKNNG